MLIAALIPCLLGYLIGKGFSSRPTTHQTSAPAPAPAPAAPAKSIWELSIAELEQKQADIFKALWK